MSDERPKIDTASQTWIELKAFLEREIELGRNALEQADSPPVRGAIAFARRILSLGDPPPKPAPKKIDYSQS